MRCSEERGNVMLYLMQMVATQSTLPRRALMPRTAGALGPFSHCFLLRFLFPTLAPVLLGAGAFLCTAGNGVPTGTFASLTGSLLTRSGHGGILWMSALPQAKREESQGRSPRPAPAIAAQAVRGASLQGKVRRAAGLNCPRRRKVSRAVSRFPAIAGHGDEKAQFSPASGSVQPSPRPVAHQSVARRPQTQDDSCRPDAVRARAHCRPGRGPRVAA